jgi:transposase
MPDTLRHVGLDVHAETIAIAVAEADGAVRELGVIRNRPDAVRKLITKLGPAAQVRVCYEAGPTGYPLYWQLTALGVHCDVIAPSLIPTKAGDRVKTDPGDRGAARSSPGARKRQTGPTPRAPSAEQVPVAARPPPTGGGPRLDHPTRRVARRGDLRTAHSASRVR